MMNDQFQQDPEEDLPDWLKELRNQSVNPSEDQDLNSDESDDSKSPTENVVSQGKESEDLVSKEPITDSFKAEKEAAITSGEPDWLQEIRQRHQQETETNPLTDAEDESAPDIEAPESSSKASIEDQEKTEEQEESEEDDSRRVAPQALEEPSSTPIMEVPVSPPLSEASFDKEIKSDEEDEIEEFEESEEVERSKSGEDEGSLDKLDEAIDNAFPNENAPDENSGDEPSPTDNIQESVKSIEEASQNMTERDESAAKSDPSEPEEESAIDQSISADEPADSEQEADDDFESWLDPEHFLEEGEAEALVSNLDDAKEEDLTPAELPSWLAKLEPGSELNPPAKSQASSDESNVNDEEEFLEEQERVGPLAGLSGIIPVEPEVVQMGRPIVPSGELSLSESQQAHVARLEALLAKESAPIQEKSQRIALPAHLMQVIFAALLILATLFPLIKGSQLAPLTPIGGLSTTSTFFNQIEILPTNTSVLVAFEVQPALYGEMKTLASTVINHLLDRQAQLIFISTQATGPALVERLLAEELNNHPNIASADIVNLGYLSGGTAALRYFASNPKEATLARQKGLANSLASIESVSDFGLVLTITGDAEDAKAWIEQVSPLTTDGFYSLSSAQAAPLLLPYLESDPITIQFLISGIKGAADYESLRNQDGLGRKYWDAYSYGLGAIALLILFGSIYGRLIQTQPQAPKERPDAN